MSKRLLVNFGLLGISSAFSIGALELGIRWFCPPPFEPRTPNLYMPHPALGHVMRPSVTEIYRTREFETLIRTNTDGFRGNDHGAKGASTVRIVGLGDSFTLGAEVDEGETYLSLLEALLNDRADTLRYETINLGVRAYGTQQEILTFLQKGLNYEPDVVILQFYTGNDLYENPPRMIPYEVANGFIVPPADPARPESRAGRNGARVETSSKQTNRLPVLFNAWLGEHSKLYVVCRGRYRGLIERWRAYRAQSDGDKPKQTPLMKWMKFATQPYSVSETADMRNRWAIVDNLLRDLSELSALHGFRVFLMDVPLVERIDPDVFEAWGLDPALFDPLKPERRLRAMAERYGFALVPLCRAFSTVTRTQTDRLYYPEDGHWTRSGHQLAAQILYEAITQRSFP